MNFLTSKKYNEIQNDEEKKYMNIILSIKYFFVRFI